ncbi:hypothetical protein FXO38_27845 [Capsicum annuum]|nr:hypothetical protein FXO38_27845 [Capsicum annuum]
MSPKRKESESGSYSDHPTTKDTVHRDTEELPEQSQLGKSKTEERYENNIDGGGQGSIDGDEENKSEKEEELESVKEDNHQHDDNGSPMGCGLISTSQHDLVKTISIERFQVAMPIDDPAELTGELVLKCQLGKFFNYFRNIMKKENIDEIFKRSFFGRFLELSEDPPCPFPNEDGIWSSQAHYQAWAFEAIPLLQKQVIDYLDEFSYPRMFRWLATKSNTRIKEADLFNPPNDAELAGATDIRRAVRQGHPSVEALRNQNTPIDSGASSGGVAGGVDISGRHADATPSRDGPFKKVDIYAKLSAKEKRDLQQAKQGAKYYLIHTFFTEDFIRMTNMRTQNLKDRYDYLSNLESAPGGERFYSLLSRFQWDKEMIKYVREERPNPHNKRWTEAKRIL